MAYTFDDVLDDELVTVVERNDEMGEFVVRIGNLETPVSIELGRFMTSERTKFRLSHVIKTPMPAGPYRTSLPFGDDPGYALHRAIDGRTSYYRQAVEKGHEPSEDWLVPY